jgi:hypothetical protein
MTGEHRPGVTDIWAEFEAARAAMALDPDDEDGQTQIVRAMLDQVGSLRRGIGTPDQIRDIIRRYEAVGVDQIIFQVQLGKNDHRHICESLELFAREVMPEFSDGRQQKDAEKEQRLRLPIKEALARAEHETVDVSDFFIAPELSAAAYADADDD